MLSSITAKKTRALLGNPMEKDDEGFLLDIDI